ncbi:Clavaminate synthase-like protein [Acrodontium crateriforme]|uniref:Clavaminate synthase-like protein n=1 Tax=Acrodontium crateriforme TaxID=150365 RepID=A0AAQ3M0U2_9PEZI|nr:Clavaminate synthase-like protein [Acrodontium crateriforme]
MSDADTDPVSNLIKTYHSLNANVVDILPEEPSPLEFMRYVAQNRPFIVRHAATSWSAVQSWNANYLTTVLEGAKVKVANTPAGNADAVVEDEDGRLVFVEPYETFEDFGEFLASVREDAQSANNTRQHVKYAQTQNDNLRDEYSRLSQDVPDDIPFARIALGQSADAINVWIGNQRSTTALHKDNYENIYVQIRGEKHFTLLPPCEMACVNEQMVLKGRYTTTTSTNADKPNFTIQKALTSAPIPTAIWDPEAPTKNQTPYSHLSQPIRLTLHAGDMLYLPAMWYHQVRQSCGDEGFCCAVNYWYDMEFAGAFWATNGFVRDVVREQAMRVRYPALKRDDGE